MKIRVPLIFVVALLYCVGSFSLMYLKWRSHTASLDYHAYVQMYWNTANGDMMMYNRASESQYSLFSAHFAPFLLLIFPAYLLVKHPLTLYFVFNLLISLSVIPLYYFALEKLKSRFSAYLLVLSFLLYFPFWWTHHHGFAEESFATPLLFFAFFSLNKGKSWLYLIFSFLTLALRINMFLPVLLLGIYAFVKHVEARKQAIFVCSLSIFWLLFIMNVIYPKYAPADTRPYIYGFFGDYGNSPTEVLTNMVTHPANTLANFLSKKKLLLDLFGPVLFLSILAPEILFIGLPILFINMLASYPRLSSSWTYYHSSSLPFIWLSLSVALARVGNLLETKFKIKKTFSINLLILIILGVNFWIDYSTPNGQQMPFSTTFNLRIYETNSRDELADSILRNIPKVNSVATQHSYLEHTAERKWQIPSTNFNGYSPDIVLLDTWASSSGFYPMPTTDPYTNIFSDSFFFLYARNDLIKEYSIKDFVDRIYKDYYQDIKFMTVTKPTDRFSSYSGTENPFAVDVSEAYRLAQKLDIQYDNPRTLQIPLERINKSGPNDLLEFFKKTTGNLRIDIVEGDSFEQNFKIIYTSMYGPDNLTHKTALLAIDLRDLKLTRAKTYWVVLSLDEKRKKSHQKFNHYKLYLVNSEKNPTGLYYSLNAGRTWSPDNYPKKALAYEIVYGKSDGSAFVMKGTPTYLRDELQKVLQTTPDYKSVIVVGSVTQKL